MNSIAVLGSTGSVGRSTLEVIREHSGLLRVAGLSAFRNAALLREQTRTFSPDWAVLGDGEQNAKTVSGPDKEDLNGYPESTADGCFNTSWHYTMEVLPSLVRQSQVKTVVSAVVGSAGLPATWAAVDAGKTVALANKETLVMAGPLVMRRASETGARVIPVDSEHSAIFQCLMSGRRSEVSRLVLTASGGPFRGWTKAQLKDVTPEQALKHPTWKMGAKITVDSATMMNKALEIVEARWLFDIPAEQISVMIHPQSIIHSMVQYCDGSVISQMSPPDMRHPIQYALLFPDRRFSSGKTTDWTRSMTLELHPPDLDTFPALTIGFEAAKQGGTCGAVMNAANEVAVSRFLNGELRFHQITDVVRDIMQNHRYDESPSMEQLCSIDKWARKEAFQWNS